MKRHRVRIKKCIVTCKMNILVTGSDGFVGKRLVQKLKLNGHNVISNRSADGDLTQVRFDNIDVDWIVHLAARTFVPQSWKEPYDYYRVNVLGTANILECCRRTGAGITFLSSYIYGVPETSPVLESHRFAPNSPYNHSKVLAESLVQFYGQDFGVNSVILRPFNIYGAGQDAQFLIPFIVDQVLDASVKEITVQNLSPKRDYLFVEDLIEAITLSISQQGNSIYNIGSGISYSVEEILLLTMQASGINKPYRETGERRQGELDDLIADISLVKRDLGWEPRVNLYDGISKMIKELKQANITKYSSG